MGACVMGRGGGSDGMEGESDGIESGALWDGKGGLKGV